VYQISIIDDEGQVTKVPMVRDEFTVGRKEGNVIRLTERNVSRSHARILRENGRFFLNDLGSYNGTKLNGRRIRGKMPLSPGDEIGIGDYTLRVELVEGAVATAPPAAEQVKPPQITVVAEGKPGAVHILSDVPHIVGRGDEATIQIDDPKVSRNHARLHLLQGRYFIEDSGSENGILVDGRRVRSKALDPGDIIDVGRIQLYYTLGPLQPGDIKPRVAAVAPAKTSRVPMIVGLVGAVIAIGGVIYVLVGRGKGGGTADTGAAFVAAEEDVGGAPSPIPETAVASASVDAALDTAQVAPPPPVPDVAAAAPDAPPGPSAAERLAEVRAAVEKASSTSDWNHVLELLNGPELASDPDAAQLRASSTRERDARQALDDARDALDRADTAAAATFLAAIPPDARCAAGATRTWGDVDDSVREAERARKVGDVQKVAEVLRAMVAPPTRIAALRRQVDDWLRMQGSSPPPADAGATPHPTDAGTAPPVQDARVVRPDAAVAPRDAGGATPPPTGSAAEEAYNQARQLILAGNNSGCVEVLQRAPQVCRNIELLVSCFKGAGQMSEAYGAMENYVRRCAGQRKFEEYRQILQSAGRL
jgi:pSer/pThr/pTyr-binding forkhead associated (FHA) protein